MSPPAWLTVNIGSSSLKATLFRSDGSRRDFHYPHLGPGWDEQAASLHQLFEELDGTAITAVGHRIVHGGGAAEPARVVDAVERARLEGLAGLAPLHMPASLMGLDLCAHRFNVPQIACFDTAFHRTMPELARRLPLPEELGLERYGFHGINFAYIARVLPDLLEDAANRRIVVAHLGSGASLCLLENLRSVGTTMGLTPIGGIPMATRSGDLDPGVVLELAKSLDRAALTGLFYHHAGLLALSRGLSADMAWLLEDCSANARFAVDYYCAAVRSAIGAFAARTGGIDALVFTGGIGENAPAVRSLICDPLDFLGFCLERGANQRSETLLSGKGSKPILRIPADEEGMMVLFMKDLLGDKAEQRQGSCPESGGRLERVKGIEPSS